MFLGIDIGTGGSRALLIDDTGKVRASADEDHEPFQSPRTGWAEQQPDDWWRAAIAAIRAVLAQNVCAPGAIGAVGLSGQMHGAVLLDASDRVLRPAIIWCDQRTDAQCRWLTETVGASRLIALTCNPALTGFTLPKLLWVRQHEMDVWGRIRRILLPKDYIRLKLTGAYATDVADASGTLLFNVAERRWSSEMLFASEIDRSWLPKTYEGPEITGRLLPEAAAATGLVPGTPVVAGGGDQSAGAVGMGIVRPGAVSVTIGTSGVVFAATDRPALDPGGRVHTFCHAVPGRWHVMGVTQAAGLSLRWFRDHLDLDADAETDDGRDPYDRLTQEALRAPPGADGVLWAPYLMGERTPHLDAHARAALVGLSASHTRAHIIRAILEGVAFSLRDSLTILKEMRVPVETIRLGGGGARSGLWQQIQADVYGRQVELLSAEEGAAYGAALLAGVGAGAWESVDAACQQAIAVASRVDPEPDLVARMDTQYAKFRRIYPALKGILEE